jgi:hypothetical protein
MANFVTDGSALPGTKVDANAPGTPSNEYLDASEANVMNDAIGDIRTFLNTILVQANVLTFGADPTGVSDSSSAFASAFAALSSGGICIVPQGSYKIAALVTCPGGVIMYGAGVAATILNVSGSGQVVLSGFGIEIRDMQVTSSITPTAPSMAISLGSEKVKVRNVYFTGCAAGALGTTGSGSYLIDVLVDDCTFTGCCIGISTPVAEIVFNSATTICFRKCCFSSNYNNAAGVGLKVQVLDTAHVDDCIFESSGQLLIAQGGGGARIVGCYFEDAQGPTISSSYGGGGVLSIRDCYFNKGAGASGQAVIQSFTSGVVLEGNTFEGFDLTTDGDTVDLNGATWGSILMRGNVASEAGFGTLVGCDDSQQIGDVGSYTNLATHSSFEDASHVTNTAYLSATQDTSDANATGGTTSQKLSWTSAAYGFGSAAVFSNVAANSNTAPFFVSFYARASRVCLCLAYVDGAGDMGVCQIRLTTSWKRYCFRSNVAATAGTVYLYLLPPGDGSSVDVNVDGVQLESGANRPHPLATTTATSVTVSNVNTAAS